MHNFLMRIEDKEFEHYTIDTVDGEIPTDNLKIFKYNEIPYWMYEWAIYSMIGDTLVYTIHGVINSFKRIK